MTNPTTPFSWQMPTASDLVTDLPADFETFGQAVATSMADLLGGTSGQVLSKASNTDMDFTWVTTDDANAIQNSIVDAKGDLISATANDTPARLAVGANGETLVADSSTSTGLRWQVPVNVNPILNSAMEIWQRGTSFAISTAAITYTADRWQAYRASGGGTTVSRQTGTTGFQYAARVQRDSGNASTTVIQFGQNFESSNSYGLAGQTITFSFYARAGANFSAASSNLNLQVVTGTGTDQNFVSGYTGSALPISTTKTLTTSWQRFQSTATLSSSLTQVGVNFYYTPVGTASTNDWFEITGVQMEIGSVATPFQTNGGTIQGELAACQRYYWRTTTSSTQRVIGTVAYANSTTVVSAAFTNPVPLRVPATSVDSANLIFQSSAGTQFTMTAVTGDPMTETVSPIYATVVGATAGAVGRLLTASSGVAYIGFNAEL